MIVLTLLERKEKKQNKNVVDIYKCFHCSVDLDVDMEMKKKKAISQNGHPNGNNANRLTREILVYT